MSKRRKKLANTRRILLTAQKKLLNAERELAAMRQANQQIADEVLGARIKSLPEKQQMAVKACFEAAARKSTSGMLYEKEWILECVLLRMRSPKFTSISVSKKFLYCQAGRVCSAILAVSRVDSDSIVQFSMPLLPRLETWTSLVDMEASSSMKLSWLSISASTQ